MDFNAFKEWILAQLHKRIENRQNSENEGELPI